MSGHRPRFSKAWVPRGSHALTVSRLAFAVQLSEKFGIDASRPRGAVMPLFYFDVRDGHKLMRDDDGLEFPNIEAARDEATRALGELAKDVLPGRAVREMAIEVRDEVKDPLLRTVLRFEIERLR